VNFNKLGLSLVIAGAIGCNVSSPPGNTGGVGVGDGGGQPTAERDAAPDVGAVVPSGEAGTDAAPDGAMAMATDGASEAGTVLVCPSLLAVVCESFTTGSSSTNIELAGTDGTSESGSFVSTASTPAGLTTALSSDVVVPYVAPPSGDVVLIDQTNNVLTWMNPATAAVIAPRRGASRQRAASARARR